MARTQSYDYSLTEHHVEPFQYADPDMAFLEEDADSYGDLWQFKPHITQYTFGIAKQKGYVFLKYKIEDIPEFYTWNIKEKVEQAKWPREDGGRGSNSLWCNNRADWDLQVGPTRGGLREICQHLEGILAEPQGVLPVRDGSYKSTHQPMHHSVRRLYHSNAPEVIG